jgi:hypothetical protein
MWGGETPATDAERLAASAETGAAALAEPDPDLAHERTVLAAARVTEAAGAVPVLLPEAEHRQHRAGLRRSASQRPPAWPDEEWPSSPGAWCACCRSRQGWAPLAPRSDGTGLGAGGRCLTCRPLPPGAPVREVMT